MNQRELQHFGIPGMHWGVRKKISTGVTKVKAKSRELQEANASSQDHIQSRKLLATPIRRLSNEQLKSLNARLEMEQKLSGYKSKTSDKEKVMNLLKATATLTTTVSTIYAFTNTKLYSDIKTVVEKSFENAVIKELGKDAALVL